MKCNESARKCYVGYKISGKCDRVILLRFISKIENLDADSVKAGIEMLANKLGESVIVLANERMVIVKVTEGFVKRGVNAGKIVGEIARFTGANGGGRPNFAQGGVKDASKLDEILAKTENDLK